MTRAPGLAVALALAACASSSVGPAAECGPQKPCPTGFSCDDVTGRCVVQGATADAGSRDAPASGIDAATADGGLASYSCGAFSTPSGWTTATGFRSAVVRAGEPLDQPVAATFAGGAFKGELFVVDQGTDTLFRVAPLTGAISVFVGPTAWPKTPGLLTTILWDAASVFDGNLYVGDQGGDGDGDSTIFRVDATGKATVFAAGPGPGLDDIYGMTFSPAGLYPAGLYVSGDTDGAATSGWGRFDAAGHGVTFAAFAGVEGLAIDITGRFGGGIFASMPASGGYTGDDTISRIGASGQKGPVLAAQLPGIHAITFAPQGPFGGDAFAASWATQKVVRVTPTGQVSDLATGLALTNYDGNILTFSSDGKVLFVADREASRLVCIEAK